jgi:SAM-dependent methyltransferase
MRRVVFLEDLRETEIRPDSLYEHYKEMVRDELKAFLADKSQLVKTDCPGCGGKRYRKAFVKMGFRYNLCRRCGSLFASPRPTAERLDSFYRDSKAIAYWRNEVAARTREARYRNQFFPLGQWVLELADEYLPEAGTFADYRSKYPALLSTIDEAGKFKRTVSVKPELPLVKGLLPESVGILDDIAAIKEKTDVFTAFEVIERIFDPIAFIKEVHRACRPRGLFFFTTNTSSGFEYQILNGESPRLHPPDRINLLSIEAIQNILNDTGFEVIELSTPGRLDVEIVRTATTNNPDIPLPEFLRYIFKSRDEKAWHALQGFLQQSRLSSYVRVMARKRQNPERD